MFRFWRALFKFLKRYFHAYGGWRGLLSSPFFAISFVIAALNYSVWLDDGWVAKVESLIPSLLGFSLGTYAIIFSILSGRIKGAARQVPASDGVVYLEKINAIFFHYIFVQVLCLLWAILFQGTALADVLRYFGSWWSSIPILFGLMRNIGAFVGYFLLVYSIMLMLAAAIAVYRLAMISDPAESADQIPPK